MKPETKKRLEEFIERAEKIRTYSYLDRKDKIIGFEINKVGDKWQVDYYQPNDEQRDALLLHLRLFLQDKDGISFRKLAELHNDPGLSANWKSEFESYRDELNLRLDNVAAEGKKGKISYRDILHMFLFGKIAHNNPDDEAHKLYQKWVTNDWEYKEFHNTFHEVIIWLLTAILNISSASKEELQRNTS